MYNAQYQCVMHNAHEATRACNCNFNLIPPAPFSGFCRDSGRAMVRQWSTR